MFTTQKIKAEKTKLTINVLCKLKEIISITDDNIEVLITSKQNVARRK